MTPEERTERIGIFLQLVSQLPLQDSVDTLYKLVCRFDTPGHADRDFVYECLIAYYSSLEEYEKCAKLVKLQKNKKRNVKITSRGLTIDDLLQLKTLRFDIPDEVVTKILQKAKKINAGSGPKTK
jgi:hypothetical protein